jgi:hypothetical protein
MAGALGIVGRAASQVTQHLMGGHDLGESFAGRRGVAGGVVDSGAGLGASRR